MIVDFRLKKGSPLDKGCDICAIKTDSVFWFQFSMLGDCYQYISVHYSFTFEITKRETGREETMLTLNRTAKLRIEIGRNLWTYEGKDKSFSMETFRSCTDKKEMAKFVHVSKEVTMQFFFFFWHIKYISDLRSTTSGYK